MLSVSTRVVEEVGGKRERDKNWESPKHNLARQLGSSSSACNKKIQLFVDMAPKRQRIG